MKQKIFITILLLCIISFLSILFFIISQMPAQGIIIDSTSNMSDNLTQNNHSISTPLPVIKTNCLEISQNSNLPTISAIKEEIDDTTCVMRASLEQIPGQITISVEKISEIKSVNFLDEHTGVRLRESNPQEYMPILDIPYEPMISNLHNGKVNLNNFESKVFVNNTEITGFFFNREENLLVIISIHSVAKINKTITEEFWSMVNSVTIIL